MAKIGRAVQKLFDWTFKLEIPILTQNWGVLGHNSPNKNFYVMTLRRQFLALDRAARRIDREIGRAVFAGAVPLVGLADDGATRPGFTLPRINSHHSRWHGMHRHAVIMVNWQLLCSCRPAQCATHVVTMQRAEYAVKLILYIWLLDNTVWCCRRSDRNCRNMRLIDSILVIFVSVTLFL